MGNLTIVACGQRGESRTSGFPNGTGGNGLFIKLTLTGIRPNDVLFYRRIPGGSGGTGEIVGRKGGDAVHVCIGRGTEVYMILWAGGGGGGGWSHIREQSGYGGWSGYRELDNFAIVRRTPNGSNSAIPSNSDNSYNTVSNSIGASYTMHTRKTFGEYTYNFHSNLGYDSWYYDGWIIDGENGETIDSDSYAGTGGSYDVDDPSADGSSRGSYGGSGTYAGADGKDNGEGGDGGDTDRVDSAFRKRGGAGGGAGFCGGGGSGGAYVMNNVGGDGLVVSTSINGGGGGGGGSSFVTRRTEFNIVSDLDIDNYKMTDNSGHNPPKEEHIHIRHVDAEFPYLSFTFADNTSLILDGDDFAILPNDVNDKVQFHSRTIYQSEADGVPVPSIGGVYAQDVSGDIVDVTVSGSVTKMHWKGTQTITFDIDNITDDAVIAVGYNPDINPSYYEFIPYISIADIVDKLDTIMVSSYNSGTDTYNSISDRTDYTDNPTGNGNNVDFIDVFTLQKNVLQIKSNSIQDRDFGIFVFNTRVNTSTTYDYIGKLGIDIQKFNNSPVLDETTISLSVEVNNTITYLLGASKEFDEVINFHFSETSTTFDDDWVENVISGQNRANCGQELTLSNGDKVSIAKDSNLMTFECLSSEDISFNYWANDGYYGHYIGGTYTTYSPQSSMGTITVTKFQAPTETVENIVIYMPSNLTRTTIVFPSGFTTYEISGGTYTDITSSLPTLTNGTLTSNTSSSIHFKPSDLTMRTTTFDYKVTNAAGVATIKDVTIFSGASGFKDGSDTDLADKYARLSSGSGVTTNYQSNGVDLGSIFEAKDSPTSGGSSPYKFTISGTTYKFDEYFEAIP